MPDGTPCSCPTVAGPNPPDGTEIEMLVGWKLFCGGLGDVATPSDPYSNSF